MLLYPGLQGTTGQLLLLASSCMQALPLESKACMRPQRAHQRPDSCLPLQEPPGRRGRPASRAPQVSCSCLDHPAYRHYPWKASPAWNLRGHITGLDSCLPLQEPPGRRDRPASRAPQVSCACLQYPSVSTDAHVTLRETSEGKSGASHPHPSAGATGETGQSSLQGTTSQPRLFATFPHLCTKSGMPQTGLETQEGGLMAACLPLQDPQG